jgi:hypothetical protein
MDRLKIIFIATAIVLGGLFAWFSSNFFYTLLWAFMEKWDFKEANVIAYTLAHITPFILIVLVVLVAYLIVRNEMSRQSKFEQPLAASDDTSTFPAALYVPGTWMQTPMLVEHGVIHINIDMINGTNEDIYLKAINGSIAVTRVDQNDDKKALGELSSPRFAEMRRNHIDKFQGFSFTLVQDLPKRLVTELSNWGKKRDTFLILTN